MSKKDTILYLNGIHVRLIDIEKKRGLFVKAHFIEHINYFYIKTLDLYLSKFGYYPIKNRSYSKNISTNKHIIKNLLQLNIPIGFIAYFTGHFDLMYEKK